MPCNLKNFLVNNCCPTYDFPFANEAITVIPYTAQMKNDLGAFPRVTVMQLDPDTGLYKPANVQITFNGTIVHVDQGGFATGVIKLI